MAIKWTGLRANTAYSAANNQTQDDAVVGMQDTIWVTGPGYGGYKAVVRIHDASGEVVAEIPLSGGGGPFSAPAPVRILDDSTTYSYSLEISAGSVPSEDVDGICITIVGGASKRYPAVGSATPSGDFLFSGAVRAPKTNNGLVIVGSSSGYYGPYPGLLQPSSDFGGNYSGGPAYGPTSWGYALSHSALPFLANWAIPSTTVVEQEAQMAKARLSAPSHVLFFVGSNDAYTSTTFATIWDALRGWADEVLGWGGAPIMVAPFARTTTSTAQAIKLMQLRNAILDYCAKQSTPCYCIDALGIIAQSGSATLAPKTDYVEGAGIHLTNKGAITVGRAISDLLSRIAPTHPDALPLIGYDTDTTMYEMLQNPQLAGTNGAMPTNWTANIVGAGASVVYSNQLRANGHNALRVAFTAANAGDYIQIQQGSVPGRVVAGQWATSGVKLTLVSGGQYLRNCSLALGISTGDALQAMTMQQASVTPDRKPWDLLDGESWWEETGRWQKVDAVTSRFGLTFSAYAAGTFVIEIEMPYTRLSADGWPQ